MAAPDFLPRSLHRQSTPGRCPQHCSVGCSVPSPGPHTMTSHSAHKITATGVSVTTDLTDTESKPNQPMWAGGVEVD